MRIALITQARRNSTRLPNKILKKIGGETLLGIHLDRLLKAKMPQVVVVATTKNDEDREVERIAVDKKVNCYRGSEEDVLDRFYRAALENKADYVVRVTSDCPLLDPLLIDQVIGECVENDVDYCANTLIEDFPDGQDVEVLKFSALERAWNEAVLPSHREHVTLFIRENSEFCGGDKFKALDVGCESSRFVNLRMTVDHPEDFEMIKNLVENLGLNKGWEEYANYILANPLLAALNQDIKRNQGLLKSRKLDLNTKYKRSQEMLERALKTIPLGSQTFSKSKTQFPVGVSPFFAARAQGCYLWDVDGNRYHDFMNSLAAITLGYGDPDVNRAVHTQLDQGTIFSLAHELEFLVSEKICELVPGAEMVRFGKNGSDATAGAIRLARAYTGKDHVLVCGYHGWQDWYIGSTSRDLGVPQATKDLTHTFKYNSIESLEALFDQFPNNVAAVILEPSNLEFPQENFLEKIKEVTHNKEAVLIFDEVVTGFRFAKGGAQEYFGVTPDLAAYGKGLANGFPLSAIAGKSSIMKLMEDIFFSFTFGGETLSLAASLATLQKIQKEPVLETISSNGTNLINELREKIIQFELDHIFEVKGHPSWSFLLPKAFGPFDVWDFKTLFMQEMLTNNVLSLGTHNLSYAHKAENLNHLFLAYDMYFDKVKTCLAKGTMQGVLKCEPLRPLFAVR